MLRHNAIRVIIDLLLLFVLTTIIIITFPSHIHTIQPPNKQFDALYIHKSDNNPNDRQIEGRTTGLWVGAGEAIRVCIVARPLHDQLRTVRASVRPFVRCLFVDACTVAIETTPSINQSNQIKLNRSIIRDDLARLAVVDVYDAAGER